MSEYHYNEVDRESVEDVILCSTASSEACNYQQSVQSTYDTYWPNLKESWESNDRDFWQDIFDESEYTDFSNYVQACIEDPNNYHPFTIRQTERHIEQHCRSRIEELAPPPAGRYTSNEVSRARNHLPSVPAAPPNCSVPTQLEWVCRLLSTLHYDCPRLPSGFQIRYSDDRGVNFKFADFITTIRDGRLAVVEITMRWKQFDQKLRQLEDYVWLLEKATGVQPEAYLVQIGLVTDPMKERMPSWCTGYYSLQGFNDHLSDKTKN